MGWCSGVMPLGERVCAEGIGNAPAGGGGGSDMGPGCAGWERGELGLACVAVEVGDGGFAAVERFPLDVLPLPLDGEFSRVCCCAKAKAEA